MATIKNLTQLKAAGGVVSREPVKKEVTWKHVHPETGEELDDTFDIWVLRANIGIALSMHKESTEPSREAILVVCSKLVMLEDDKGKKIQLPYEEWDTFDTNLTMAIYDAVQEVRRPPKNSQPPTNCSANSSPVELVAPPLKKLANG